MRRAVLATALGVTGAHQVRAEPVDTPDLVGHVHPVEGEPCAETTDVVGYRECTPFGQWAAARLYPQLVIETGVEVHRLADPPLPGNNRVAYRTIGGAPSRDLAVSSIMRILIGFGRGGYAGLETGFGGVDRFDPIGDALVVDYEGVVGFGAPVGLGSLATELVVGGRTTVDSADPETVTDAVAEVRVRGDVWLSPWFSFGIAFGASVLDQGAWMGGAFLGFHTYSYGGTR